MLGLMLGDTKKVDEGDKAKTIVSYEQMQKELLERIKERRKKTRSQVKRKAPENDIKEKGSLIESSKLIK